MLRRVAHSSSVSSIQAFFWLEWDEENSGGEDQETSMSAEYSIPTRVLCGEMAGGPHCLAADSFVISQAPQGPR